MSNIPSLDLSKFTGGNPQQRAEFIAELGDAYTNIGFASISGHGFSAQEMNNLYTQVEHFFSLPIDTKKKYEMPDGSGQRGYTSFGREHAKDSDQPDLKEFWHFGQTVEGENAAELGYPDNILCDELPEFNQAGLFAYRKLESIGRDMLRAIALFLNLPENYFEEFVINGNSILRPIHYPPITHEPKNAVRAGAHEDINLITLLMGASAEGLEVLNKQGEYVAVTAIEDQLVINVGDMLQRLTNGRLKSTTHRVVNPPREKWGTSRYSIPFFLHPKGSMSLNCLDNCVSEDAPKQFSDITAGDYLNERLAEIGLKK